MNTLKSEIPPEVFKQKKANQHLFHLLRDEYETWELISQILVAEKNWFERQPRPAKMCPKSFEQQSVLQDHESSVLHAVTHWLEKIYERRDVSQDGNCATIKQVYEYLR